LQTITLTTDGATATQIQAASSITYTSIQAPSYYTVTTSIDALTLTTVLAFFKSCVVTDWLECRVWHHHFLSVKPPHDAYKSFQTL
jgi:hypothetical protein